MLNYKIVFQCFSVGVIYFLTNLLFSEVFGFRKASVVEICFTAIIFGIFLVIVKKYKVK